MANLDSLIKVDISLGSPGVTIEGFGTILIATDDTGAFALNEVRTYLSPEDVDNDPDLGAQAKLEAKAVFTLSPSPDRVKVADYNNLAASMATELSAIEAADPDWYGLVMTGTRGFDAADIEVAFQWVSGRRKLYSAQTSDADVINAVALNIAETLQTGSYENGFITYHDNNTEPEAVIAIASLLAVNPDVATTILAHKIHPGIPKQTQLTSTQLTNILTQNANVYSEVKGLGSYQKGKTPAGFFVDVILSKHWMEARMEEAIAQVLSDFSNRGRKVPYNDSGFALFDNVARRVLRRGVTAEHINRDSETVTVPRLAEVPPADRTARLVRLDFSAVLTGAAQEADWTGSLLITA